MDHGTSLDGPERAVETATWPAHHDRVSGGIDSDAIVLAMHICVLALDDVFDTGLAAALDTIDTATDQSWRNTHLQNAASHSGGSAIEVHVERAVEGVAIGVRDHGSGIAAADVARVFDAFFRADASRTRATGGVRLGLTLPKRIVDAHGGSIALSSELGRGDGGARRLAAAPAANRRDGDEDGRG